MVRRTLGSALVLLLFASVVEAQFFKKVRDKLDDLGPAPEVQVTINHPPGLGLEVSRVAFGPEEGECSGEFIDALISDFTGSGVEVVNRRQMEALMAEHEFSLSGVVRREDAVELGEILGPTALVFVSVRRCTTEPTSETIPVGKYEDGSTAYEYVSRRTGFFQASIQVVDLASARIDQARTVGFTIPEENRSRNHRPPLPSEYQVLDRVMRLAVNQIHNWFFPWTEHRTLKYFDNTDCNLQLAYNLVRGGDYVAAREQSEENVRACEVYRQEKPKLFARAVYNLGMSEFLLNNYDAALAAFDQSLRIEDLDPTPQAILDCRRAKESALELQQEFAEGDDSIVPASGGSAPQARSAEPRFASAGTPASAAEEKSLEEQLGELKALYDKGLISEEVYKEKQAELLEKF
jgi:tetratricopeptide (TPR) repeat protein